MYTLSVFLVPIIIFLYIFIKDIRGGLFIHCICIFLVGIIDTISKKITHEYKWGNLIKSFMGHSLLILLLLYYQKIEFVDMTSHILLIVGILCLMLLPEWPYVIHRKYFITIYILLYAVFVKAHNRIHNINGTIQ